jgi:hypothetical protein
MVFRFSLVCGAWIFPSAKVIGVGGVLEGDKRIQNEFSGYFGRVQGCDVMLKAFEVYSG